MKSRYPLQFKPISRQWLCYSAGDVTCFYCRSTLNLTSVTYRVLASIILKYFRQFIIVLFD